VAGVADTADGHASDPDLPAIPLRWPALVVAALAILATYYETDAYAWLHQYPMKEITPSVFLVDIKF
jgi:hypothetical protein